ncbi:MAG: ABC transporter substrate-binding protein, partial [Clostridia bacterium]
LRSGGVDGYVAERPGAEADIAANPDLTYVAFEAGKGFTASENDVSIAVGLKKESELLAPINEVLAGIDAQERLQIMLDATTRQPLNQ